MRACCDRPGSARRIGWRRRLTSRTAIIAGPALAAGGGLVAGGWSWLVAAGAVPTILAILPCAITCGFGLCVLGIGNRPQSTGAPARLTVTQNSDGMLQGGDAASVASSIPHRQSPNAI